ncbi:glycosyltransferase family 4 protein [Leifsonia shinshuensis]|uniref:glycosyltransferase family 4 protein n=1 Tax=Leifsonia shinshuensis TaxID=150026 RepID=UPI001F504ABC|nr:glycosyltransferase family 4 protein [Leifsonia shinshuensis]MCI0157972.1 glycosyltransferase family 4 protein [Leifsonia shinshuensis]
MNGGRAVFFVVPDAIDDPDRVSGGNRYDQRVRDGLRADGWAVRMVLVTDRGAGPTAGALAQLPENALVLVDGLLATREPAALTVHGARLRLVVLVHLVADAPTDDQTAALRAARRIIATSDWTRSELLEQDAADPHRIVVAHPGTDPAPATRPSASGGRLLCVATVAPHKGQDLLVRTLIGFADRDDWTCNVVGSLRVDPDFVEALRAEIDAVGLAGRVRFTGVLTGRALEAAYADADLMVLPSRTESYGMAVAEALAHGVPVLATAVGGLPEAIAVPGAAVLVPPDDVWALHVVLQQWWTDPALRSARATAAFQARAAGRSWSTTTSIVAAALDAALADVGRTDPGRTEAVPS